jgi:hypothetical protein
MRALVLIDIVGKIIRYDKDTPVNRCRLYTYIASFSDR